MENSLQTVEIRLINSQLRITGTRSSSDSLFLLTFFPKRFLTKIVIDSASGCWNWTGAVKTNEKYPLHQYGCCWDGERRTTASRYAYGVINGKLPVGLEADHLCFNKLCCNPLHLEAVTHHENVLRRRKHGPPKGTLCRPQGWRPKP